MVETPGDRSEIAGYGLWVVGILFFVASALKNGDWWSFAGSAFFLVGIVIVMVPMVRRHRQRG